MTGLPSSLPIQAMSFWVSCGLEAGVPATLLLPSVLYMVWPILDFSTASRQVHDDFGDEDLVSELNRGTERPISADSENPIFSSICFFSLPKDLNNAGCLILFSVLMFSSSFLF